MLRTGLAWVVVFFMAGCVQEEELPRPQVPVVVHPDLLPGPDATSAIDAPEDASHPPTEVDVPSVDVTVPEPPVLLVGPCAEPPCSGRLGAGWQHSCALDREGKTWCWGAELFLGSPATEAGGVVAHPVAVPNLPPATDLAVGSRDSCALEKGVGVWCWGGGRLSPPCEELGLVPYTSAAERAYVGGLLGGALIVYGVLVQWASYDEVPIDPISGLTMSAAFGTTHVCAIVDDAQVFCWGENEHGQLGDGSTNAREPFGPRPALGLSNVTWIAAGYYTSCAATGTGEAYCWGVWSQDPAKPAVDWLSPTRVSFDQPVRAVVPGKGHTCAIVESGSLWCWGANDRGQLGDGTFVASDAPVRVTSLSDVTEVSSLFDHTCAADSAGFVYCWGANESGQLGDGTTEDRPTPTLVQNRN